jgi:transposase
LGKARSFKPYETLPGEQMLYDWSEYSVNLAGNFTKIYVHITILGHSRYRTYNATLSIKQADILDVLEESFHEFGGVCQRIQVDNARVFVDNASVNNFKWNLRFLNFCGFYGVKPTRSLPGHPWSKGKVENPFYYLENHFINNRRFDSFEDFYDKLKEFQQQVNNTLHNSLNKKPYEASLVSG